MSHAPESRFRMILTALGGLILTILPLPEGVDIVRPAFLVLIVLYWSTSVPRAGGIGLGFFSGLALDTFQGPVLGEHALALSLISYVAVREHQRFRSKPIFQQSLMVMGLLGVYELSLFVLDIWTTHPVMNPMRWLHVVTSALLWPPTAAILSQVTVRR
jgi:rod shape-determining protein MreD